MWRMSNAAVGQLENLIKVKHRTTRVEIARNAAAGFFLGEPSKAAFTLRNFLFIFPHISPSPRLVLLHNRTLKSFRLGPRDKKRIAIAKPIIIWVKHCNSLMNRERVGIKFIILVTGVWEFISSFPPSPELTLMALNVPAHRRLQCQDFSRQPQQTLGRPSFWGHAIPRDKYGLNTRLLRRLL